MTIPPLEAALLVGLAAFRASRFISRDKLIAGWRHRFYRRFPPNEQYCRYYRLGGRWQVSDKVLPNRSESKVGVLVDCMWCSSVWSAAAITAVLAYWWSVPVPVLVWGAACAFAGLCAYFTG